jgi:hypothetical protein
VVLLLVEVTHTNLTEVTRVVLVNVGTVVVLTTGHTTTTGMLAVLADTSLTGRDVTAARRERLANCAAEEIAPSQKNFVVGFHRLSARLLVLAETFVIRGLSKQFLLRQNSEPWSMSTCRHVPPTFAASS